MAFRLYQTLKEAITVPFTATFFTVLALFWAIYYVATVYPATFFMLLALLWAIYHMVTTDLFGSTGGHHQRSPTLKEEPKQNDGSTNVSQSRASSSSSSSHQQRYQVFLSFRGEDTRYNFTSHLLEALKDQGIEVFFDEETLEHGEKLNTALLQAISASMMSIVILSKDYASSKSCLTELSEIMECKDAKAQIVVIPIFYHVDPSDVRKHGGSFKRSFDEHLINKPHEVERWKAAFTEIGEIKGFHIKGHRTESTYIKEIVQDVLDKLNSKYLMIGGVDPSEELVGIEDKKEKVLSLLRITNQEEVNVVGICGMGGIGKTKLAETVYSEVFTKFDGHCFLNVREIIEKKGRLVVKEFLSEIFKGKSQLDFPHLGCVTRLQLSNKRVFVVLDDVNDLDEIGSLSARRLFGRGSKIVVISRDKQVLQNVAESIYDVKVLNDYESLRLFCNFAFKRPHPIGDFHYLSSRFVEYAGGIPLALKVLGRELYKRPREHWESVLDELKKYPNQNIINILKISFDGLNHMERNIFLDIAIFHKHANKAWVTNTLKCCYRGAVGGISKLADKCLIDTFELLTIKMHDLLRELAMEIVRQESEDDPGRRSRLWSPEDVYYVLKYNKGTELIKGISLDVSQIRAFQMSPTVFEKMVRLVYINFHYSLYFQGDENPNRLLLANQEVTYLPDTLRFFNWDYCPLKSLPSNFNPNNLVELRLRASNIEQLWNGYQEVANLRRMSLTECDNLRKIPHLLGATKLEYLLCDDCESLVEIPCMTHLKSLRDLYLSGCPITKFPEIEGLTELQNLSLSRTQIEEVPSFIGSLEKLCTLNMSETLIQNIPSSIGKLAALAFLYLSYCQNITELNLNMTPLEEMPSSISPLQKSLDTLDVENCKSLKSLLGLPPWLKIFDAKGCTSLERVSFLDYDDQPEPYFGFRFFDCFNLNQDAVDNIIAVNIMMIIQRSAKKSAKKLDAEEESCEFGRCDKVVRYDLPGSEISDNFEYQSRDSSITVMLGSARSKRFLCFALCLVLDMEKFCKYKIHIDCQLKGTDGGCQNFKSEWSLGLEKPIPAGCCNERVFVLFEDSLVHRDMNYKEASFDFRIIATENCIDYGDESNDEGDEADDDGDESDNDGDESDDDFHYGGEMKVKKCGVHVFYVDADSFIVSHAKSSTNFSFDEDKRCSPNIIQPNSIVGPHWLSQESGVHNGDSGGSMAEEGADT